MSQIKAFFFFFLSVPARHTTSAVQIKTKNECLPFNLIFYLFIYLFIYLCTYLFIFEKVPTTKFVLKIEEIILVTSKLTTVTPLTLYQTTNF